MNKYTMGDIHGGYKSLKQCLDRAKFNYEEDELIVLGDVVDGWPETPQCIEELLKIKHLIYVIGNHDVWARDWFEKGSTPIIWTQQGGQATIDAYIANPKLMIEHRDFFKTAKKFHKDDKGRVFVHGGFDPKKPIEEQSEQYLTWDRDLFDLRHTDIMADYKEDTVFVGHTSIWNLSHYPLYVSGVVFMDTGGGYDGKLSLVNIDTGELFQSDRVDLLYKGIMGR